MRRALLASAVLAGGSLVAAYWLGWIQINRPDPREFTVQGIDVSHHQGAIDWRRVAADGIHFAFIKSSEGRDLVDPAFERNWRGAGDAGIQRGAYHFFTFCAPGRAQAENFLAAAPPDPRASSPVVDVEFVGNCAGWTSLEDVRAELAVFLELIRAAWQLEPILYLTGESYERIVADHFDGRPVWIRSVFSQPRREEYGGWLIWQYSDASRVRGIAGAVDRDVLRPGAGLFELRIALPARAP